MTLNEFKSWAVGQGSVAKYTDGKYKGECVSLINQYLARVYGISAGLWGNAKDWATNSNVLNYFDKVSSPQAGDIGVYTGGTYGHIWIYLSATECLEQNGKSAGKVTVNAPIFKVNTILRRKGTGGSMAQTITDGDTIQLRIINSEVKGWDRNEVHSGKFDTREINAWRGQPWGKFVQQGWDEGVAYRALKDKHAAFYNKYVSLVGDLEARPTKEQLTALQTQLTKEAEKVAKAEAALKDAQAKQSEDTILLDNAGSWLTKLFNRLFKKG